MAVLSADLKQRIYSGKQLGYIDVTPEGNPTEDELDELAPGEAIGESRLVPIPEDHALQAEDAPAVAGPAVEPSDSQSTASQQPEQEPCRRPSHDGPVADFDWPAATRRRVGPMVGGGSEQQGEPAAATAQPAEAAPAVATARGLSLIHI